MQELFIDLIRVAIGNQVCLSRTPSADEWGELYAMAKKQMLMGVSFAGVQLLQMQQQSPPEMLYLQWMGMAAKIQQRNIVVGKQCGEVQKILAVAGFRSCILKGQSVAQLYPKNLISLRQPGDIDVWVNGAREQVIDYVLTSSPTKVLNVDFKNIHWNIFNDTEVEVHFKPVVQANQYRDRILTAYFDAEFERQSAASIPTVDFQLIHQLLHIYQHYLYEGVSMKQLLDLYFAQCVCMKEPDLAENVRGLFGRIGLIEFVGAIQWVLQRLFRLDNSMMLCAPNEREGKVMLTDVMNDENSCSQYQSSFIGRFVMRMYRKMRFIKFDWLGVMYYPIYRLQIAKFQNEINSKYGIN